MTHAGEQGSSRAFRYSAENYQKLSRNQRHEFAWHHCQEIYRTDAIYTFIPKNACTPIRFAVAKDNGAIEDITDLDWIHQNNWTFRPSLRSLNRAKYAFVLLRCPYQRVASAFLDNIVDPSQDRLANSYRRYPGKILVKKLGLRLNSKVGRRVYTSRSSFNRSTFTFRKFLEHLSQGGGLRADHHWAPQVDFLVYKTYDDFFCVEDMTSVTTKLREKIDLQICDTRTISKHAATSYERVDDPASDLEVSAINKMKESGSIPSPESLYDHNLKKLVADMYKEDLDLYISKFGAKHLLFK